MKKALIENFKIKEVVVHLIFTMARIIFYFIIISSSILKINLLGQFIWQE